MRLLFIQNFAPDDPRAFGGQRIHHELTRAMANRGHDARAVFLTPTGALPTLPYPAWGIRETGRLQSDTRALRQAMPGVFSEWLPDVVYGGAAESAGAVEWAKGRCATIATSHHYDLPSLVGGPSPLQPLAWLRDLRRLQRFRLEKRLLVTADLVLVTSRFGGNCLTARGYLSPDARPPVLLNGVDDSWFGPLRPARGRHADGQPSGQSAWVEPGGFLFVGRMDTQKGVDVLLESLTLRVGSWPLNLVGGGWMEDTYRAQANALGLGTSVTFLGLLGHDDLRERIGDFDAFVLPSRAENCPLVLLEAMAAGLPIVTTDVGGIPELVADGESGLMVAAEDPEALAQALDRMEADAELRQRLTEGGRVVAERQRWGSVAERLEAHLTRLLGA